MQERIGKVLVIGAGIAGMQSALDLAEAGFKIYLIDEAPSIGGRMAQLDKTFPTNDCSMCILSPKLVECGRHINIETITYAEVIDVTGEVGNFKVKIRKKARYIDEKKCTGCGECETSCPVEVADEFQEGLSKRKAIFRLYPQAFPNVFTIGKKPQPCQLTCPAGVHIQGYIALINQKKYEEALALIKKNNPLPAICGRICPAVCEKECRRALIDEPIAISHLKRFVADYVREKGVGIRGEGLVKGNDYRIAIVGSGPAGLTCAYYLSQMGYKITIFEALEVLGGMLRVGIPDYRLPKDVLNKEIESILDLGIEVKTGIEIGKDLSIADIFHQGYKAIFIATGTHKSLKLNIPNEDSDGVISGVDFLRELNLGKKVNVGKNVVIIGGGDVAIDAARTCVRLGATKVTVLYRRSREEMPARVSEIEEAEKEGIQINFLVAPKEVLLTKAGKVNGLRCIKMKLSEEVDGTGRRKPIEIPGSEFDIKTDTIITAIGQTADTAYLKHLKEYGLATSKNGTIIVDEETLSTSKEGIFAGGDAVLGPATAIEAIAHGRKAALSIDAYIKGDKLKKAPEKISYKEIEYGELPSDIPIKKRQKMKTLSLKEREGNFKEVEMGFTEEQALKEAERCLSCGICAECLECIKVCEAGAIHHDMEEEIKEIDVGAIILAGGYGLFDAKLKKEYGYGIYENVLTSIQFERILSATGPYQGEIKRLSDGKHPKSIAFIQCVGSRDVNTNKYCSAVCCMYTIKEAIVAKEHDPKIEPTIFFMDIRSYGKGFETYYERAKNEYNIRFIRARPAEIKEVNPTKNLIVKYADGVERIKEQEFELVVLASGISPHTTAIETAKKLNIALNEYNFCKTNKFDVTATSKAGIFVSGLINEPKDIPETVIEASAAAANVSSLLAAARGSMIEKKEYPPEKDVSAEEIRIGVFVCHCGRNIGSIVNVSKVVETVSLLPDVVYATDFLYTCSQNSLQKIKETIEEYNLNRVVVAACSPRTHEGLFRDTIREVGLNPYLFEMANIRDQCSWVHTDLPEAATQKAKELVAMAVAKARLLCPIERITTEVKNKGLVIGGGLAGLTAALSLANQGFEVHLIEKEKELGGNLRKIYYTLEDEDIQSYLKNLIRTVEENNLIHIYKETEIKEVTGFIGNFKTKIETNYNLQTTNHELEHGIIIVATGAKEYKPKEYLYGQDERIVTQLELEEIIEEARSKKQEVRSKKIENLASCLLPLASIVMIQCVGSRNEERKYCSRICCSHAIKNALKLKKLTPEVNIYILYRDMRSYGFKEDYYREAQEKGVVFIRYDEREKPQVYLPKIKNAKSSPPLIVEVYDTLINQKIKIAADLVVLSSAIIPQDKAAELTQILKVPLTEDGFFQEAHLKLRPVDFSNEGMFLCGLCHSPKNIDECISSALASAARAATILSKEKIETAAIIATVNEKCCVGCGLCVSVCPYDAREVDEEKKVAEVNTFICQGCGACATACPSAATQQLNFQKKQILTMIDTIS